MTRAVIYAGLTPLDRGRYLCSMAPEETLRLDAAILQAQHQTQRKGTLLVIDGSPADIGCHVVVESSVTIGRECEGLQLRDRGISRTHARVAPHEDGYRLYDLGSTNGTLLNGKRVVNESHDLRDGDQIGVGQSVVKFTLVNDREAKYLHRMERQAGTDELTGLLAKHRFDSLLQHTVQTARARQQPLCLLMMDLDGLKAINDTMGHQMGAHTIKRVGEMIGGLVSGKGEACRFGGDEFCMLLHGTTLDQAKRLADELCQQVRETTFALDGRSVRASISVGIAELNQDIENGQRLVELADEALYRAKAQGRDTTAT